MIYRRLRTPSMWRDMDRMQREMNRVFESYSPRGLRSAPAYPAMNVWGSEEGLLVTAELPGVSSKDIELSVVNETLTVSGERVPEELVEEARYHRRECGCGKFTRSIQLPFAVDASKVEASFKNGVLHVSLPRKAEDKPRKIKVKVG